MSAASSPVRATTKSEPIERALGRYELACATGYSITLLWINVYICREFFSSQSAYMNSMHGFWTALAKHAGFDWFEPKWWPYWDCGIPLQFTYAPLVPTLAAIWAGLRSIPHAQAFQCVTGMAYCLAPFTLFLMAWLLTRAPAVSFIAALFYSLTAPTQLIVPAATFSLRNFWDAHRFYDVAIWDDTPHLLALTFLALVILFLSLSIRKRRLIYYAATAVSIALASSSSAFGVVSVVMAALCLLFVLGRADLKRNVILTICIGAYAWALAAPFLSPSLLNAIRAASANHEGAWSMGSLTAAAIVVAGWVILWRYLPRWTSDWRLQFFALFAFVTSSAPILATYVHKQFLPQPLRYLLEMEIALALLVVFGLCSWFDKLPQALKRGLLFLLLALAGEQIVSHRKYAKAVLYPRDSTETIEYQASSWAEKNLPGVRVMMPGSMAQWANAFTGITQFAGSSWSMAYNPVQQRGLAAIYNGGETPEQDARVSLAWLQAFGAGAIAVPGPKSHEFWKPFAHPAKFEGVLPAVWRKDDVTVYTIPQRNASLAHVVDESAIVRRAPAGPSDVTAIERYVAALDNASLPPAELQWDGPNRIRIRTSTMPQHVISLQVSYHPGWHANVGGRKLDVRSDALGLMWLQPGVCRPCEVALDYDGGWEFRVCRYASFVAMAGLLVMPVVPLVRRRWLAHAS